MFVELNTIKLLLPEIFLVAIAAWIYVGGAFTHGRTWWAMFAAGAYLVAALALFQQGLPFWESFQRGQAFASGPLVVDFLGYGLRWLALLAGFSFTLIASRGDDELAGEYLGTLMLVIVGVMLVAAANELVFLFVALELVSIPTYVLLFLGRRDWATAEATAKYFFLSILSSALLLYGFSFLYGVAGTTLITGTAALPGIREALQAEGGRAGMMALAPIALVLIFAGLGFKIAAAPFHFYAPDVYQGATNTNAGLLAIAPKIAGVVALVRLTVDAMPATTQFAWQLALVLAVLTMTLGNICALWQQHVRRLMAYSSIAHAGYMLIGLAVGLAAAGTSGLGDSQIGYGGLAAMVFYLLVYVLAALGAFAALAYLGGPERELNRVDELAGLAGVQPLAAAAIAVFMFSLAGVPPLAGFWGKLTLLTSAVGLATTTEDPGISYWFVVLAVIAALNAAIAAAYYLRVVAVMYFRPAAAPVQAQGGWGAAAVMGAAAVLVVGAGVLPGPAVQSAGMVERAAVESAADKPALAAGTADDDRRRDWTRQILQRSENDSWPKHVSTPPR